MAPKTCSDKDEENVLLRPNLLVVVFGLEALEYVRILTGAALLQIAALLHQAPELASCVLGGAASFGTGPRQRRSVAPRCVGARL